MRSVCLVGLVLASLLASGCGTRANPGGDKPAIAVSIFPLYDLTRRIAGDRLDVLIVLPPGKSEHSYEPAPQEVVALSAAKVAFVVGLGMDGWVEPVVRNARVVRLGDAVQTLPVALAPITAEPHADHAEHADHAKVGAPDPHFWLDPERMLPVVDRIAAELATLDPAGKALFATNADAVKSSLKALDATLKARANAWPVAHRKIVTFHGSMTYFAKRYGLRIVAVVEPVAGTEPTAAYIIEVLEAVKLMKAAAIFSEPQLDKAPGETISREAKIPLGELDPVGGLPGRDSYEALLTWNADQLEKLLK